MAEEQSAFGFEDVARSINDKMIRRHPHVFAEETYGSLAEQKEGWEALKAAERKEKGAGASLMDDVPAGLPALTRAVNENREKVGLHPLR